MINVNIENIYKNHIDMLMFDPLRSSRKEIREHLIGDCGISRIEFAERHEDRRRWLDKFAPNKLLDCSGMEGNK